MQYLGPLATATGLAQLLSIEPDGTLSKTAGGSGSGAIISQASISVSTASRYFEANYADAGITPAHKIIASLVGELDAENDLEEISDSEIIVSAIAQSESVLFILTSNAPIFGAFKINYWSSL